MSEPQGRPDRPDDVPASSWLAGRPAVMGILNVNADSFSDPRSETDATERAHVGIALHRAGATYVDVGAESASPATPVVEAEEEIDALLPVLARLHEAGVTTSVDTYKPPVVAAVVQAGTALVNDYSGLVHPEVAELCADAGARLVLTHNPAGVKNKLLDPERYLDVVDETSAWFEQRLREIERRGLVRDHVVLDPGIDLSKTPAQSIEVLRGLRRLHDRFGLTQLLAISRKDFIGALTGAAPRERDAGTLAALTTLSRVPSTIARVHDVAAATQYLDVLTALEGPTPPPPDLALPMSLRREG